MSEPIVLPAVNSRLQELAFQLAAFRSVLSRWQDQFDSEIIDMIDFITIHYPNPRKNAAASAGFLTVESLTPRPAAGKPHPQRVERFVYPADWTVDRSCLNRADAELIHLQRRVGW
jgi:hypothetical protein